MTLPADTNSDNDTSSDLNKKSDPAADAGKALAPSGSSPVNPFLAAAAEDHVEPSVAPRAFAARMLDYSAHAAIIVGLIGFAWTVGDHVVNRPSAKPDAVAPIAAAAIAPEPTDEIGQLRLANSKMHDELKALRASVDTLRSVVRRDTTPEQVRLLSAGLDSIKGNISSNSAAIAQLNGKIEKLQPTKLQALGERIGKLEHQALDHQALDPASTGSLAKSDKSDGSRPDGSSRSAPKPPSKPTTLASNEDQPNEQDNKPQVISGWVVRDVYRGVALIESKRGSLEVVPGVSIPGAGVVKSIERHGGGWTVTTTKGQLAYSAAAPQRDYRRDSYQRGNYSPYRYGY